jgi:hypothetical protein
MFSKPLRQLTMLGILLFPQFARQTLRADDAKPIAISVFVGEYRRVELALSSGVRKAVNADGDLLWTARYGHQGLEKTERANDFDKKTGSVAQIRPDDTPTSVFVDGKGVGLATFTVIDKGGGKQAIHVSCQRCVLAPLGRPKLLRMSSGKPIKLAKASKPVIEVRSLAEDRTTVVVRSREKAEASVLLTAEDGTQETVAVFVRSDKTADIGNLLMPPGDVVEYRPPGLGKADAG